MNEEDLSEGERLRIADELRRIREGVRDRALIEPGRREVLPPPPAVRTPEAPRKESRSASSPLPSRPDNAGVNASWRIRSASAGGGLGGRLARAVLALLDPTLEAQEAFNSKQVQLDNELLSYVDARLDATHRHYDEVLGIHGRHMGEIDERHMIVQEELVAHVHDLVRRIDLVLSEAERGRLSLEFALKDLRTRVERIEQRLRAAAEGRTERE